MGVMGRNHLLAVWRDVSLSTKTRILFASEFSSSYSVIQAENPLYYWAQRLADETQTAILVPNLSAASHEVISLVNI